MAKPMNTDLALMTRFSSVRIKGKVYVLHAFQKKSKKGIQTPQKEINVIKSRLKRVEVEEGI
ncbi:MAG: hypothetical protein B6I37_01885 [Desulfobacteraceae bacterium 4572_35.2]|nr:MAG: hypothetical protein B6I37_01885 [Desulfobacteraceae bacterium 4572_35.2]